MSMTNEQIKQIIDGAPDGATHYFDNIYLSYTDREGWKYLGDGSVSFSENETPIGIYSAIHHLSDLRRILKQEDKILALRERVEQLGQWVNEIQGLIYQNTREPECCGQGYGECCGNFVEGYPKWVEELPQPPKGEI